MEAKYILLILVTFNTAMVFNLMWTLKVYRKNHDQLGTLFVQQSIESQKLAEYIDIMVASIKKIRKSMDEHEDN